MYIYIYVFKYICINIYIYTYICIYTYMCVCVKICTYIYMYTYIYMCVCVHTHIYIYAHIYIYVCVCVNICIYIYIYINMYLYIIHIHIYIHIHTYTYIYIDLYMYVCTNTHIYIYIYIHTAHDSPADPQRRAWRSGSELWWEICSIPATALQWGHRYRRDMSLCSAIQQFVGSRVVLMFPETQESVCVRETLIKVCHAGVRLAANATGECVRVCKSVCVCLHEWLLVGVICALVRCQVAWSPILRNIHRYIDT